MTKKETKKEETEIEEEKKKIVKKLKKKKQTKEEVKKEEAVHVRIESPTKYRREILHLAITTIRLLKKFEEFKNVRDDKKEMINKLRHAIRDLQELNHKLDVTNWPHIEIKFPRKKAKKRLIKAEEEFEIGKPTRGTRKVRIEKLESDMEALKRKLEEL